MKLRPIVFGLISALSVSGAESACARAGASPAAHQTASPGTDAEVERVTGSPPALAPAVASQAALKWLAALRQVDRAGLIRQSGVPFILRDASRTGACAKLDVGDPSKLDGIGCLLKDDLLHAVLKTNPEPDPGPLPPKLLPNWARRWKAEVPPGSLPVGFVLLGKAVSFDLVVLVKADGVHGLLRHTSHERN